MPNQTRSNPIQTVPQKGSKGEGDDGDDDDDNATYVAVAVAVAPSKVSLSTHWKRWETVKCGTVEKGRKLQPFPNKPCKTKYMEMECKQARVPNFVYIAKFLDKERKIKGNQLPQQLTVSFH